jgi:hypothetical protein
LDLCLKQLALDKKYYDDKQKPKDWVGASHVGLTSQAEYNLMDFMIQAKKQIGKL